MKQQKGITPIIIVLAFALLGICIYQFIEINKLKNIEQNNVLMQKDNKEIKKEVKTEPAENIPSQAASQPNKQTVPQATDKLQDTINEIATKLDQFVRMIPGSKVTAHNESNYSYKYNINLSTSSFSEEKVDVKCIKLSSPAEIKEEIARKAFDIYYSIFTNWDRNVYMQSDGTITGTEGYVKKADKIFCGINFKTIFSNSGATEEWRDICCGYYKNDLALSNY
jgi:hypothetical protein